MLKLITQTTSVILALMLALPMIGCQQKVDVKKNEKGLDVEVDAGGTKVKVEGRKNSDGKGRHVDVDVDVERHKSRDQPPSDENK